MCKREPSLFTHFYFKGDVPFGALGVKLDDVRLHVHILREYGALAKYHMLHSRANRNKLARVLLPEILLTKLYIVRRLLDEGLIRLLHHLQKLRIYFHQEA